MINTEFLLSINHEQLLPVCYMHDTVFVQYHHLIVINLIRDIYEVNKRTWLDAKI